jgi:tetratricopeptide (TPR) repeat protein
MSEDTKILGAVASVVVLGAIGLAVLGWMGLDDDADVPARAVAPEVTATPASYTPEPPQPAAPPIEPGPVEPALEDTEPAFRVEPGEDYVARGLETYGAREFDKACAYFRAAVDERPGRPWTQYMLGLALWKAGRLDEAAAEMTLAAETDADPGRAWVNLSRIQNDRGEFDAALDAAHAALALHPDDASALFLEGRSLRNLGRHDEALESLARSIELDPDDAYAHNLIGLTRLDLGRPFEAVASFETAAELEPGVAYIRNNLGMALEHDGRRAEAVEAYAKAVEIDSGHVKAIANLARLEPLLGEDAEVMGSVDVADAEVGETVEVAEAVAPDASEAVETRP